MYGLNMFGIDDARKQTEGCGILCQDSKNYAMTNLGLAPFGQGTTFLRRCLSEGSQRSNLFLSTMVNPSYGIFMRGGAKKSS